MKNELTTTDAPKIALALGLLLALGSAGWISNGRANARHEEARMMRQMQLESGTISSFVDGNLSPEAADEAENERQANDPNFQP